jgi:protein-disulfide isomerase
MRFNISRRLLFAASLAALLVIPGSAESPAAEPENVFLFTNGAPSVGDEKAPVIIVEFSDYQCPYCGQHANQVLPQIIKEYVNTGRVRYFFRDVPVEANHPQAFKAAEAAHCAGDQGKYWEMHDRLFKNQHLLAMSDLAAHAQALGIDGSKFQRCLDGGKYAPQIRKDIGDAIKFGVRGTPTFFVGKHDSQRSEKNAVTTLTGAEPFVEFQRTVDQMLSPRKTEVGRR